MTKQVNPTRSLIFGGLIPVIAYTVIEEVYGLMWGLVAGMVLGVGELSYEWISQKKVSAITVGSTLLILGLGGISLFTQEGIWFKLQPAIMEAVITVVIFVSIAMKRPLLVVLSEKQGMIERIPPRIRPLMLKRFEGLTFRLGIFFLLHTGLAVWAAFFWSTRAWAFLKGLGFTLSMAIYLVVEVILLRRSVKKEVMERTLRGR